MAWNFSIDALYVALISLVIDFPLESGLLSAFDVRNCK